MISFAEKIQRRIEKMEKLENGRRQFSTMPGTENRAYVWIGNVSFPVTVSR